MKTILSPSWELSTDHSASSYGRPVLVKRATGEAFGLGDIVKLNPSYGYMTAGDAVRRLAGTKKLDAEGLDLVARFTTNSRNSI
jgi:hypothetical protein